MVILMRIYIPFTIMITLNLIVISRLRKSKHTVNVSRSTNGPGQGSDKQFRFQVSMVIVDFTFLIFYTPRGISLTMGMVDLLNGTFSADPLTNVIVNQVFLNLTQLLGIAYSAFMNIFFVMFNRIYRKELIKLFCLKRIFATVSGATHSSTRMRSTITNK